MQYQLQSSGLHYPYANMLTKLAYCDVVNVFFAISYTLAFLLFVETSAQEAKLISKYEYKYSFKGPHLVQPDSSVPFWSLQGDTVAADDKIRLVPSIRDKKGLAWCKYAFEKKEWEVEVQVRIEGRGKLGADGLGIWYTSGNGQLGPVYGASDYWNGVGIFLDSFDNNNQLDNPSISVVFNNGTMQYQHDSDGTTQHSGSCKFDFRNKPYPVKIRARYEKRTLSVSFTSGNFPNDEYFQTCTVVENVDLPSNYYFGVSAATGGLADDHDVIKFLTSSLIDTQPAPTPEEAEDEAKKVMEEYGKNMEEFNKMQEEYQKEHPDSEGEKLQSEELYEGTASKELISIFEVQSSLKEELRSVSDMIKELMSQQGRMSESLNSLKEQRPAPPQEGSPPAGADDNAKTYHIDNVLNLQREAYDVVRGIRDELTFVKQIVTAISQQPQGGNQAPSNVVPQVADSYESIQFRETVKNEFNKIADDLGTIIRRQGNAPKPVCPEPEMPSCVSLGVFVVIAVLQVLILIIYQSMRMSKEEAAKKFF